MQVFSDEICEDNTSGNELFIRRFMGMSFCLYMYESNQGKDWRGMKDMNFYPGVVQILFFLKERHITEC